MSTKLLQKLVTRIISEHRLPKDANFGDLIQAFRRSGLHAVLSPKKEQFPLTTIKRSERVYEDQHLASIPLPFAKPLEIPDVPPSMIGDLLSFGRFVNLLQLRQKSNRGPKKCFDFDFLCEAITLQDGSISGYLTLLKWLVWAFDQRKGADPKLRITQEFGIDIQEQNSDQFLACELLRKYLSALKNSKRVPYSDEFLPFLTNLITVDISDTTVKERVSLLISAHQALIQNTDFVNYCISNSEGHQHQAVLKMHSLAESIRLAEAALDEMTLKLKMFDETPVDSPGWNMEQRAVICDDIEKTVKDVEVAMAERDSLRVTLEEARHFLVCLCHSECLGYDRYFNRYWHFPELNSDLFVESGWVFPLLAARPDKPLPSRPIVANFYVPEHQCDIHYLQDDGIYGKCEENTVPPRQSENKWSFYEAEMVPHLINSLNDMGIRESRLKSSLQSVVGRLRPPPYRSGVPLPPFVDMLSHFVSRILEDLDSELFLTEPLAEDWRIALDAADLAALKQQLVSTYDLILKIVLRKEFIDSESLWKGALVETNNLSRFYYICLSLDKSIKWEQFRLEGCKKCDQNTAQQEMLRCRKCGTICHRTCMVFTDSFCALCTEVTDRRTKNHIKVPYAGDNHSGIQPVSSKKAKMDRLSAEEFEAEMKEVAPLVNGRVTRLRRKNVVAENGKVHSSDEESGTSSDTPKRKLRTRTVKPRPTSRCSVTSTDSEKLPRSRNGATRKTRNSRASAESISDPTFSRKAKDNPKISYVEINSSDSETDLRKKLLRNGLAVSMKKARRRDSPAKSETSTAVSNGSTTMSKASTVSKLTKDRDLDARSLRRSRISKDNATAERRNANEDDQSGAASSRKSSKTRQNGITARGARDHSEEIGVGPSDIATSQITGKRETAVERKRSDDENSTTITSSRKSKNARKSSGSKVEDLSSDEESVMIRKTSAPPRSGKSEGRRSVDEHSEMSAENTSKKSVSIKRNGLSSEDEDSAVYPRLRILEKPNNPHYEPISSDEEVAPLRKSSARTKRKSASSGDENLVSHARKSPNASQKSLISGGTIKSKGRNGSADGHSSEMSGERRSSKRKVGVSVVSSDDDSIQAFPSQRIKVINSVSQERCDSPEIGTAMSIFRDSMTL